MSERKSPEVVVVEDSWAMRYAWRKRLAHGSLLDFESPTEFLAAIEADASLLQAPTFIVLDNQFAPGEMEGISLGKLIRERTGAVILLCSSVERDSVPPWFDGQLEKRAHNLEELTRCVPDDVKKRSGKFRLPEPQVNRK